MELSVVVPIYNEEENIEPLVEELARRLSQLHDYELILVDDGSVDRSMQRLRVQAGKDSRIKIVRFARNCGQTAAIQAGFDVARGDIIVTMDGDLQNDPKDIPALMNDIREGFDVVSGWRKDRQDRALTRRAPSVVANWLIGRLTGVRIHDNGCTLKAYRKEHVKKTFLYAEMHRFLVPMLSLTGARIKEVAVNHRSRQFGQSKYGLSRIWKVFLDLLTVKMVLRFSSHPAAWFALIGAPFAVAGLASAALSMYLYSTPGSQVETPIVVPAITVLLFFSAVHLMLMGMLAELIVKMGDFKETDPLVVRVVERERHHEW